MARKMRTKKQRRAHERREVLPRWKYREYILSKAWSAKRRAKFAQVGRKCERCGSVRGKIHVHHKTYDRLGVERLEDLEVICEMCHLDHHLGEAFGVDPAAFDQIAWRI
jgi:5-methylcytosine-specific restriction endonuclease McrA